MAGFSDARIVQYKIMYEPATYRVKRLLIEVRLEDERYGKGNLIVNRGVNGVPPYTTADGVAVGQGDKLILSSDGVKWYNTQACCGN